MKFILTAFATAFAFTACLGALLLPNYSVSASPDQYRNRSIHMQKLLSANTFNKLQQHPDNDGGYAIIVDDRQYKIYFQPAETATSNSGSSLAALTLTVMPSKVSGHDRIIQTFIDEGDDDQLDELRQSILANDGRVVPLRSVGKASLMKEQREYEEAVGKLVATLNQ